MKSKSAKKWTVITSLLGAFAISTGVICTTTSCTNKEKSIFGFGNNFYILKSENTKTINGTYNTGDAIINGAGVYGTTATLTLTGGSGQCSLSLTISGTTPDDFDIDLTWFSGSTGSAEAHHGVQVMHVQRYVNLTVSGTYITGVVGQKITPVHINASGGVKPYTYTSNTLTTYGLSIDKDGWIKGTPTAVVSTSGSLITVKDKIGQQASNYDSLSITSDLSGTGGIIMGTLGESSTNFLRIVASGGSGKYRFSASDLQTYGLSINEKTGVISGQLRAWASEVSIDVTIKDYNYQNNTFSTSVILNVPNFTTTGVTVFGNLQQNIDAEQYKVVVSGAYGPTRHYCYELQEYGLSINEYDGSIVGTPTQTIWGQSFTDSIFDNYGNYNTATIILCISDDSPSYKKIDGSDWIGHINGVPTFLYNSNPNTLTLTGFGLGTDGDPWESEDLVIPGYVEDDNNNHYKITNILEDANTPITAKLFSGSISIPSTVESLNIRCLFRVGSSNYSTSGITHIQLNEGLVNIYDGCFQYLSDCLIDTLIIPSTVKSIGSNAFRDTHFDVSFAPGSQLDTISEMAFSGYNGAPSSEGAVSLTIPPVNLSPHSFEQNIFNSCIIDSLTLSCTRGGNIMTTYWFGSYNLIASSGPHTGRIYVPSSLLTQYRNDPQWRDLIGAAYIETVIQPIPS